MTTDTDRSAETMPDLLAALQASVDRQRGTTMTEPAPVKRPTGRPPLTDAATLLDAADRLGYPGLTVGAVTAAVGVKYSTFYRHFGALERLVAALADRHFGRLNDPDDTVTPREYLHQLGDALLALVEQRPGIERALLDLAKRPARLTALMLAAVDVLTAHGADEPDARVAVRHVVETALAARPEAADDDPFAGQDGPTVPELVGTAIDGALAVLP